MNVIHKIHTRHTNSGCAKVRETGVGEDVNFLIRHT